MSCTLSLPPMQHCSDVASREVCDLKKHRASHLNIMRSEWFSEEEVKTFSWKVFTIFSKHNLTAESELLLLWHAVVHANLLPRQLPRLEPPHPAVCVLWSRWPCTQSSTEEVMLSRRRPLIGMIHKTSGVTKQRSGDKEYPILRSLRVRSPFESISLKQLCAIKFTSPNNVSRFAMSSQVMRKVRPSLPATPDFFFSCSQTLVMSQRARPQCFFRILETLPARLVYVFSQTVGTNNYLVVAANSGLNAPWFNAGHLSDAFTPFLSQMQSRRLKAGNVGPNNMRSSC